MKGKTAVTLLASGLLALALTYGGPVQAGPTDTPLPTFSDAKAAVSVYIAAGVIKNNNLDTDFICTNVDTVARDVGVELFDETGALRNSVAAGNGAILNVGVGRTVTFGSGATAVLHEDQVITLNAAGNGTNNLRNGSARVVGTSKNISCTAIVVDKLHTIQDPTVSNQPPPTATNLPLLKQ